MTQTPDKQTLITALHSVFDRWEALLAGLSEAQISARTLPSDLSVKDVVAHLRAWQQVSSARLEAAQAGSQPDYTFWPDRLRPGPDEPLEDINAWIHATYLDQPWSSVHAVWRAGFQRFVSLVEAAPEADLEPEGRFAWLDGLPLVAVISGSLDHHIEHLEGVAQFLGMQTKDEPPQRLEGR
jgi:hypothetical protein